ncbi:MAG TPA: glycoside hydrolase family 2 TIM barrel-domain containing protein [Opitutaceae bacterium]|nr:glycoside hydrolase family 2 TIM barrel-domain containing protein [Opitutaceae bacterium]
MSALLRRWVWFGAGRCLLVASLFFPGLQRAADAPRVHQSFDFAWRFCRGEAGGAQQPGFDDAAWRQLDLPHDWSIEGPYDEHAATGGSGGYLPAGIGWYRKHFTVPEGLRGRQVTVEFDGVYMNSDVWINGRHLGGWPYGYTSFCFDLTPDLHFGDQPNVLAVRVDNSQQPGSRWYSGSGIDRHVWITITDPLHVAHWGTWVTTPDVSAESATVRIRTRVQNGRPEAQAVTLISELVGSGDAVEVAVPSDGLLAAGSEREFDQTVTLGHPRRWSPDTPELYRLRSRVVVGGRIVDETVTPFGVRQCEFDAARGFLLNHEPVKLRGMCLHHDGGAVGAAVPEAVWARRLRLLKEMGCNAVRTAHNPPAPEFLDLCDRLGLLVMDEAFDEWTIRKPQIAHGYSSYFNDWYERDLTAMIHRDRNHPCVVLWSAGNEIGEQEANAGPEVLRKLIAVFHREDPTRPVTVAMDNIFNQHGRAPAAFTDQLDVVGYNYVDRWGTRRETQYRDDHDQFPQRKFIGTEDSSVRGTRGVYRFGPLLGPETWTGEVTPAPGPEGALYLGEAMRAASLWRFEALHDYVAGDFAWTGIDYLGEARWPRKGATSGSLDTCGFKKDGFYFYQSLWTNQPMLHLLPHWNWPDRLGKVVPVVACTNCAAVELFLNGRSLGAKAREFPQQGVTKAWNSYGQPQIQATTDDFQLVWDVVYEPGELKAVGYDRNAAVVAGAVVRTAGPAAALALTVDRATLAADARDVAHVTVEVQDANGVVVPDADNNVTFTMEGDGTLLGVDNGDPLSHASYRANSRQVFHGLALALVQAGTRGGAIRVTATSPGLKEAAVVLQAVPAAEADAPVVVDVDR